MHSAFLKRRPVGVYQARCVAAVVVVLVVVVLVMGVQGDEMTQHNEQCAAASERVIAPCSPARVDVVWDWLIGSGLTQLLGLFSLCAPVAVHTVTMEIAGKYQ
ncbi:unnamed protein product [Gadus morhua 'NCC']